MPVKTTMMRAPVQKSMPIRVWKTTAAGVDVDADLGEDVGDQA